jgi:hypothetical protein
MTGVGFLIFFILGFYRTRKSWKTIKDKFPAIYSQFHRTGERKVSDWFRRTSFWWSVDSSGGAELSEIKKVARFPVECALVCLVVMFLIFIVFLKLSGTA